MKRVLPPTRAELQKAYEILQWNKSAPDPKELVLWAQWARLDPRLGEVLVNVLADRYESINPFHLWRANNADPEPQALLVLVEFAALRSNPEFRIWRRPLEEGVLVGPPQAFFVREGWPRPNVDIKAALTSLKPYSRWGYFGREDLARVKSDEKIISGSGPTIMGKAERFQILEQLLKVNRKLTVSKYIQACGGRVHRRTAERDLREHPKLRSKGFTRGKEYF